MSLAPRIFAHSITILNISILLILVILVSLFHVSAQLTHIILSGIVEGVFNGGSMICCTSPFRNIRSTVPQLFDKGNFHRGVFESASIGLVMCLF